MRFLCVLAAFGAAFLFLDPALAGTSKDGGEQLLTYLPSFLIADAHAQVATTTTPVTVTWAELLAPFLPGFFAGLGTILTAVATLALTWAKQRWNVELDDSMRDSLQTALANGVGKLSTFTGTKLKDAHLTVSSPEIKDAVLYVRDAAKDAVEHFHLDGAALADKVVAKLGAMTVAEPEVNPIQKDATGMVRR